MFPALPFSVQRQSDVRTEVHLRKRSTAGKWRQSPKMDIAHPEWNDADPCSTIEEIQLQFWWNERSNSLRFQCPMSEQQIVPALGHNPWTVRQWPGTVIGTAKDVVDLRIIHR